MATFIRPPEALLDALDALGIGDVRNSVRRVVIDLQVGNVPIIHVEHIGDERLIQVVQALEGVDIRREPASVGGACSCAVVDQSLGSDGFRTLALGLRDPGCPIHGEVSG